MGAWQVRVLGGLSITGPGGQPVTVPGQAARALLVFLLTQAERTHARDLLAGTFWPELPESQARRRLNQALWQIRKTFAPAPLLISQGDAVRFDLQAGVWLDCAHFEQQAGCQDEASLLQALECYRGDFMAGYYDDWLLLERERLRSAYLGVLERLITAHKARGAYESALIYARRLAAEEPWREQTQREIMRIYHLLGRPAEALQQYQICQKALAAELDLPPEPKTQTLAVEIARRAGLSAAPWVPAGARPSLDIPLEHPERLPLIGRRAELAELLHQLDQAAQGRGGLTLVSGEAGVGKTHLLQELARNARWRGLSCSWGHCSELAGSNTYQPLVEILRAHLPLLKAPSFAALWRAGLAHLLPELAGQQALPALEPVEAQRRLLEAIANGFQAIAHAAPGLILIEDAHWLDPASQAALHYLLPRLPELGLRLVITVRREELTTQQAAGLASFEHASQTSCLQLERLNQGETGELVQSALGLEQPPQRFSDRLYLETEGNPFFVTEILRTLVAEQLLYRNPQGQWSTAWDESTRDYRELPLPGSVVRSILRRLAGLPDSLQASLGLAAVIGRQVGFELWLQAGQLAETDLLAQGDELQRRGLFVSPELPAEGVDYVFAHDQLRRVVYEQLSPPRRRRYHQRVAQALEILEPGSMAAQAYHWSAAQSWEQAARAHQQAGEQASAVYAFSSAALHYRQALEMLARLPGRPDLKRQFHLHLGCEQAYSFQGERTEQSRELQVLAGLAEALDDDHARAVVNLRLAWQALATSDYPAAINAAGRAVQLAQAAQNPATTAAGFWAWGWSLLLPGEHSAARARFQEVLQLSRQAGQRALEADALHGLGTVYLVTCNYRRARWFFQQVLEIGQQIDIRPRVAKSLNNLGYITNAQNEQTASRLYNEKAWQLHQASGDQKGVAVSLEQLGAGCLAQGDFSTALEQLQAAIAMQEQIAAHENLAVSLLTLGRLYHQLGAFDQAGAYYERALAIFERIAARFYLGSVRACLGLLAHHQDDNQGALRHSQLGLEVARQVGDRLGQGWLLDVSAHAQAGLGDLAGVEVAYRQAWHTHRRLGQPQLAAESMAGLARLALAQGDLARAQAWAQQILAIEAANGLDGGHELFRIYLSCYQVLAACQEPQADQLLARASAHWQRYSERIPSAELQQSFLENVAARRQLGAAYQARQACRQVSLPAAGAPLRRALRPEEYVSVCWTIHAPEDQAIPAKAARRQHRLLRLIQEAHRQGAVPAYQDLAEALGVSTRTIERDMATLVRQGHQVPLTRGKMSA